MDWFTLFGVPLARPPQRVPLGGAGGNAVPGGFGAVREADGDVAAEVKPARHWTFDVIPLFRHYFSRNSSFNLRSFPTNCAGQTSTPRCRLGRTPSPAKLPSKKWRDVILKAWHTDPLICPQCQQRMRVLAVIDHRKVIEKILRHLNLWGGLPAFMPSRGPPSAAPKHWEADDPQSRNPFPDYDNVFTD